MRQVHPHRLWLGTALDARDLRKLYEHEIAAVIDLAIDEPPARLGREIIYCRFPLMDGRGNPDWLLRIAIQTTVQLLRDSVTTLVACSGGMSRTPALAAAAISATCGTPPDDCLLQIVEGQPHDVSPLLWQEVKQALLGCAPSQVS
jgi:protein-tyrosine phosphatase